MKADVKILSPLEVAFYDTHPAADFDREITALRNEAASFRIAVRVEKDTPREADSVYIKIEVDSPIADRITVYSAESVAVGRVGYGYSDEWFLRKTPGIYPDRLQPIASGEFTAVTGQTKMLVVNVNESLGMLAVGRYPIRLRLIFKKSGEPAWEGGTELRVIDAVLPALPIKATNWIHYDCIAHFAGVEPMSDGFFEAVANYVTLAVRNGQNMILTPAFTPPLDTPVGEERMTVQLVGIRRDGGAYFFDFSLLERFIDVCRRCGAEYFEHSHLFSQWGAEHAPKIMASVDGEYRRLFGWDTDSTAEEYRTFIKEYLGALKSFIEARGLRERFFFHVSDEPFASNRESYMKAADLVNGELAEYEVGDALQEYEFYENGAVKIPIVATNHADAFYKKADPLWLYYTGEQSNQSYPNRLIGMPEERQRVLGFIIYTHNAKGLLHWGFNAHHNLLSRRLIDPSISPDMGGDFSSGTSYLVYPCGMSASPSVRLFTFRDQMQDLRAAYLLESLTGRERVLEIIAKHLGDPSFKVFVTADQLLALREEINGEIEHFCAKK